MQYRFAVIYGPPCTNQGDFSQPKIRPPPLPLRWMMFTPLCKCLEFCRRIRYCSTPVTVQICTGIYIYTNILEDAQVNSPFKRSCKCRIISHALRVSLHQGSSILGFALAKTIKDNVYLFCVCARFRSIDTYNSFLQFLL